MQIITPFTLSAFLVLAACSGQDSAPSPTPQAVRVAHAHRADLVQGRRYLAEVTPKNTVQVLARVQGTVSSFPVPEGQGAKAGEVLARLAAPDVMARLSRTRAERERAERERDFVCARVETDRRLTEAGDMAPEQLDASEKNCASARLAASAAGAAEDEVSAVTSRSTERAPFGGVVLEHLSETGQSVMPGMPLVVFGSQERELLLRVPSSDMRDGLGVGSAVSFEGGRGVVRQVGAWAKGPGQLVELRVAAEDSAALPTVGSTTSATLVLDERADACAVPVDALGRDEQGSFLLAVHGDMLERLAIATGPRQDGLVAVEPCPDTAVVVGSLSGLDLERSVFAVERGS